MKFSISGIVSATLLLIIASGCVSKPRTWEFTYSGMLNKHPELRSSFVRAPEYNRAMREHEQMLRDQGIVPDHGYRIQPGIQIFVEVSGHPEYNKNVIVDAEGNVSLIHDIRDVPAVGRTVRELRDDLEQRLKTYIRNPKIILRLQSVVNSVTGEIGGEYGRIYVMGETGFQGAFKLVPNATLFETLAESRGFNEFSWVSEIAVIRRDPGNQKGIIILVNAENFIQAKNGWSEDIKLQPKDIVVVPKRFTKYDHFERDFERLLKWLSLVNSYNDFDQDILEDELIDDKSD